MANPFARAVRRSAPQPPRKREAFNMALWNRLTADWVMATSRSADGELRYELRTMRNRARDLVRNSPFGIRYHQIIAENVVGPVGRTGFQLCAQNLLPNSDALDTASNDAIEQAFLDWARPEHCDARNMLTLGEQLCLAASSWGTDGEILIRFLRGPQFGPYGLKLQLIDPDYLVDTPAGPIYEPDGTVINQGIKQGPYGEPLQYWLYTRHPYDLQGRFLNLGPNDREWIAASDLLHAFIPLRTHQSRGVPHANAIATTLKMLDGYLEAELVAARAASATMGAIEDIPNGDTPAPNPAAGIGVADGDDGSQSMAGADIPAEITPGAMLDLRGKGHLNLWDPQHPTNAFPDFTRTLSHFVAIGFGISYGTLTGDLSQANYGSLRVGMLDERQHWARYQQFFIEHLMERIFTEWLGMALLNNKIPGLRDRNVRRWRNVLWMPRGFDWIDPVKDVQGDLMEVSAGINSLTRVAAKRGRDLEQIVRERAREQALFAQYGVSSTLAATDVTAAATTDAPPPADGADDRYAAALPLRAVAADRPRRAAGA